MKLYYSKGACSLAVRILINELALSCEYEAVNLKTKQTETGKDFLTINPKGAVPTLVTDHGDVLTENAVIHQYIADTYHADRFLPTLGNFKRYRVLEWLNYVTTEIHKGLGILFNPNFSQETREQVLIPLVKRKLDYLNHHLKTHRYLLGDEFTLPDGYLYTVLNWTFIFKIPLSDWPAVARYVDEVKARPAVQKSLQEEGL